MCSLLESLWHLHAVARCCSPFGSMANARVIIFDNYRHSCGKPWGCIAHIHVFPARPLSIPLNCSSLAFDLLTGRGKELPSAALLHPALACTCTLTLWYYWHLLSISCQVSLWPEAKQQSLCCCLMWRAAAAAAGVRAGSKRIYSIVAAVSDICLLARFMNCVSFLGKLGHKLLTLTEIENCCQLLSCLNFWHVQFLISRPQRPSSLRSVRLSSCLSVDVSL